MVAIKSNQASSYLAKPDPSVRAFLLYGPDAGSVSERAQILANLIAKRESPPGEVLRLDDSDLETDSDRLSVELLTVPMFGGAKVIRATAGRRINAAHLAPLLEAGFAGALVVEGGNLKADDKLRALFEKSAKAAAIGCYADEGASLDGLVSEVLGAAKLEISPEARQELVGRLGADRVLSRAELEKLALYAHGAKRIELEHVEAIVGDAADLAVDQVVAAACTGDVRLALATSDRAISSGESGQSIILAAERHFQRLHRVRAGIDSGRSLDDVTRGFRPPLHFRAKAELERQCRAWSTANVGLALSRISDAVKRSRTTGSDEVVLAERLLVEIARLARASGSAARR